MKMFSCEIKISNSKLMRNKKCAISKQFQFILTVVSVIYVEFCTLFPSFKIKMLTNINRR